MKHLQAFREFISEKLVWNDSDAPDANGRFKDLSIKDLAAWLIKTRKKDLKKITGSINQQIGFNQNDDKEYVEKMEKVRQEVYKQLGREDLMESLHEDKESLSCPVPTTDLEVNTKNRNRAIKADYIEYGPLNVDEPAGFWEHIADHWSTSVKAAKESLCGNCAAFDVSPRMKECMPGELSDKDGELGYCWMHHFKCHSARTCYTWAKGGPISADKVSLDWQDKNQDAAMNKNPIK